MSRAMREGQEPHTAAPPRAESRLFGTDGIRKVVGKEITPDFLSGIGLAVGEHLEHQGTVLVAWDFRTTSPGIARILAGSLQLSGVDVVEMGPMPTPCLQFNVRELHAQMGLMVTASHNPCEFNGIKFCGPLGLEIPPLDERQIEELFWSKRARSVPWDRAGRIRPDVDGVDRYLSSILRHVDVGAIRAWAPRVVLDCGNGTSIVTSPRLLPALGCRLTTLNANPDGSFPGHPSEPSPANLTDLARLVPTSGAALGIAHDGDTDRIAFIDEKGQYVPGEVTLALLAKEALRRHPGATIVTSVTSSTCIEDVVRECGGELFVTRSGSLAVAVGVAEQHAPFGGEENGHYYWPDHQNAPDGPMSSAMVLELLAATKRPFSELVRELPQYHLVKTRVDFPGEVRAAVMRRVEEELAPKAERLITIDGVKAYYSEGWVLVRPSGTEPICRIFSESRRIEQAQALNDRAVQLVEGLVTDLLSSPGREIRAP